MLKAIFFKATTTTASVSTPPHSIPSSLPQLTPETERQDDHEDLDGACGSEHQVATLTPSVTTLGDSTTQMESSWVGEDKDKHPANDEDKLECLLYLDDDIMIEDWVSDEEDVEVEIER
ncbi:hypothetical protein L1987_57757 [Smallanthus sonchifolius]|uniref:Uncharacterized protein n=1 Tax=Smallanthus sonchifolius TaxID=185202 RepID=A0ACB9DDE3_9ASTR|nr:hypothetical protein L1987_57757 [Smallanthus sonchifolius]